MYPTYQRCRGYNFYNEYQILDRSQWLSADEICNLQWKKLKCLLKHSYENSLYYHRIFRHLGLSPDDISTYHDFRKIPLLSKHNIIENMEYIVSKNYTKKALISNSTGGSTGTNLHFYNDKKRVQCVIAFVLRNELWSGLDIGDKRAVLWGAPFDISQQDQLKAKLFNKIFRNLFLSSYDLSDDMMEVYVQKLNSYNPKVIIGYPSSLYYFSKYIGDNGFEIINPISIISSAEVLYDYQRELIESVFGCKIFNRYGCREFSTIAHECSKHFGMHINAEHVYVECLDENGEPVASGEVGELVITDLDNYGMPFIRYRIGDVGMISDRVCDCGRGLPIIEKVIGRSFDVVIGTNGRRLGGTFWTHILRNYIDGIKQFQVIQESKTEIRIQIVIDWSIFDSSSIPKLTRKILDYCGDDMGVDFKIVDEIEPTKSGKYRFVISKLSDMSQNVK